LAKNIKTGGWVPDGFKRARERAEAAFAEIAGGATFDDVLRERGEFYANDETKGRMGSKPLNQLRQAVHENEFTDLLMGYSIGYHLFYDAEPGTVVGPLRGPDGYYIARVNARTPARDAPSIDDPRTRELVKQDYISYRFLQWSNEVLGNTTVE